MLRDPDRFPLAEKDKAEVHILSITVRAAGLPHPLTCVDSYHTVHLKDSIACHVEFGSNH